MKKILGIFVLVSVLLCGASPLFAGGSQAASGGSGDKPYRIAFLPGSMANESQAYSAKQFQKLGPSMGFDVTILDGRADAQVQAQQVNNCVAQKFDVIFVNPNDVNGIVPSLTAAKRAGVIVGLFSSDLPPANAGSRDIFVGVNDNEAGETAAQSFIRQFPGGANIVEIGGQSGHDAAIKRHDGFNAAIRGSNINVLDYKACSAWSTSEAMTIMEDMITKYGNRIQGVFCHWDNGATGVIEAAKAAGISDLFIVAVDGCRAGFDQVNAGTQGSSIMQNFAAQAKVSLEVALKALKKEPFDAVNLVPLDDINKSNIDRFEYPEW
ncbi:MAG: sugar ABC transporter substrate-binding protein [Treponema sp.]|jgi:ABC-type sugar transport system substrate-binding protein|nr:sugar ABC transporter substrate-binding protein [Treponema sp.]